MTSDDDAVSTSGIPTIIRSATVEDIDAVLSVWKVARAEPSPTDTTENLRQLLEHDPHSLIIATARGLTIGTLIAAWDGWRANMYRLVVLPAYRRAGVGIELVREGERRLRQRGAQRSVALVIGAHDHSVGFWQVAGYELDERMRRYLRAL